ncbi:hypothetical protein Forpi1262_v009460 [Fusarium oxysporum f. sp. raphani]|uniref:HTH CENPB-type domain-containing protein n=1 Tax=Fusarium oxysporum f. sp. raphani TaxID=96318 RepID=A0A8J5U5B4_FUSOX|nr:hypothetical protein Forpi1262_v009460 [Fusarium oxysporum f. sp. raphani]
MAAIDKALEFLKTSGSINYAATAKKFECDETTLRRRHQGKQRARRDADSLYKSRLSKQQEQDLVTYIRKLSLRGIPPTLSMIRNFAQDIAKIEVGKNWPYSFVQRHRNEIDCTWFDGFDIARRRADNASRYRAYFDLWTSKTQGLTGLSKREFWVLFWGALEASFTPENIASGWRRTGLKPFDPDVVLSQVSKNTDDDSDVESGLDDSIALQEPTARELRRLVDHVVKQSSVSSDTGARKLKRTLESLQAEVELLRHENQGLRETIIREKQRRQRGKALKDYIFDRVDPNSAQVFSPQKIAQARQKKIEMEAQKEEEVLQKRTEKALRQKRVEEQKQLVLERKRQREEKKERKRREKETKQLEREANRQLRIEMKKQNQRSIQPKHQARQNGSDGLEENGGIQDEIIVVLPTVTEPPVLFKPPNEALSTPNTKASTPPSHKTRPKRPSLVVESDREVVVAYGDSGRSQRNRKRPRWLDDFEVN